MGAKACMVVSKQRLRSSLRPWSTTLAHHCMFQYEFLAINTSYFERYIRGCGRRPSSSGAPERVGDVRLATVKALP
jgi:hypothetical protein